MIKAAINVRMIIINGVMAKIIITISVSARHRDSTRWHQIDFYIVRFQFCSSVHHISLDIARTLNSSVVMTLIVLSKMWGNLNLAII